jgi:hypothetical protein
MMCTDCLDCLDIRFPSHLFCVCVCVKEIDFLRHVASQLTIMKTTTRTTYSSTYTQ